jgi:phage terminase small subunit
MARNDVLDPREQRFVELYVETSNATRSALAAGYGRNYQNAGVYANRLLKKARIKDAVDRRNAEIMAKLDFTPDRIIKRFAQIAAVMDTEVKTPDVLKALTELAKIARLYPADRTELSGPNGAPVQSASVNVNHTMDIASLKPEQREQLRQVLLAIKAQAVSESEEQANRDADDLMASGNRHAGFTSRGRER